MNNPKVDTQLNQALNATPEEREKSMELNVGYNSQDRQWDLIVKFSGDAELLKPYVVGITELLNQYAVVRIYQSRIDEFVRLPQIEYVEKPKRLFFAVYQAQAVSCINVVKEAPYHLRGKGVLVACVDSGIDFRHPDFRNPDGTTRLAALWDQTVNGNPPEGYFIGTEFSQEEINSILLGTTASENEGSPVPSGDLGGHGTAVMGIAAGNGQSSGGIYEGVAPESDLLVVKLGVPLPDSFPRTTELIQAIDYCIRKSMERNQPLALNLSFGSSYGSREGNSLIEAYLNQVADLGRTAICVGMGNEGRSAGHTTAVLTVGEAVEIEMAVGNYQTAFNLQIWKNYVDEVTLELEDPSGQRITLAEPQEGARRGDTERHIVGTTKLLFYYGVPSPYRTAQELYLDFLPEGNYVEEGRWIFRITGKNIVGGTMDFYLPGGNVLNENTRFLTPNPERTLTIPAAASSVISVGAYDPRLNSYAGFSGRGYTREVVQVKPDLAAPGVNIRTAKSGGGYNTFTGTSFATPLVTGAAALMMEWGIIQENDPYLYGEALKANLRKGARQLPGILSWPNPELGYGVLCLRDSLPL